jgi:hypothetical protein
MRRAKQPRQVYSRSNSPAQRDVKTITPFLWDFRASSNVCVRI